MSDQSVQGVQGVQGCAGLVYRTQHTRKPRFTRPLEVCAGCVGLTRMRARTRIFFSGNSSAKAVKDFSHANPEEVCTPYTLCTDLLEALKYKGLRCVGFVQGMGESVQGCENRGVAL